MLQFLRRFDRSALAVGIFAFSFITLLYSKWLLTLSLLFLIPLAALNIFQLQSESESWTKRLGVHLRFYRSYPPYWGIGLIFLVVLVSGIFFGVSDYWGVRMRVKLPLLIAPFLFAFISPLSKKHYRGWMYLIIGLAVISQLTVLLHYFLDFDKINDSIGRGGSLSTPISHVRYSIFIAFAMTLGFWQFLSPPVKHAKKVGIIGLTIGLFLFASLHILSVRSGLVAGYLSFALCLVYWVFREKKWGIGLVSLALLFIGPSLAYKTIPSFKTKIDYSLFDYQMFQQGKGASYSDGDRVASILLGLKLFKEKPVFGVGVGPFQKRMLKLYKEHHPEGNFMMPHNQYVSLLASTGIVGFGLSMIGFLLPLFYRRNYRHLPLSCFYVIIMTSMLVENTWDTSVGLALFLLPVLIINNYLIGQRPN